MASQAVPHRRGGKHRVKDADLTHSIYDDFSYAEILELAKERGIYRKDMKKMEMAMANKHFDADIESRERQAIIDQQKRELEQKRVRKQKDDEKQATILAKHQRIMQKEMRRAQGADVSDDSVDEDEIVADSEPLNEINDYKQENIGEMVSDESWDSTSTERSVRSREQGLVPDCRLRIYERSQWSCEPRKPAIDLDTLSDSVLTFNAEGKNWQAFPIPYAPLKVTTMHSKQKLCLPGQTYPPAIRLDFVPILPQRTRTAARNGVLDGVLRKAAIERASDWAKRTQIQGDTATMFFDLPIRNETKKLNETYDKWYLEDRKLLRMKGSGESLSADRAKRHAQRFRNKSKKVMEVYEACQYRSLAVCYMPSYLDFSKSPNTEQVQSGLEDRALENLFYIRFPGCDVPHYYFWGRQGDWEDPTKRNPEWEAAKVHWKRSLTVPDDTDVGDEAGHRAVAGHSCKKSWARVKIPDVGPTQPVAAQPAFDTILSTIEHQLYAFGLIATLSSYRRKWILHGKHHAWKKFSRALPTLYPSGNLPLVPPPTVNVPHGRSLAFKIATIDTLGSDDATPLSPLQGDEAWTRDDDAFWHLVQVDDTPSPARIEEDMPAQLKHSNGIDGQAVALYRRTSIVQYRHGGLVSCADSDSSVSTWPGQLSPSSRPWPVARVAGHCEANHHKPTNEGSDGRNCPFCELEWADMCVQKRTRHVLSHSRNVPATRRRLARLRTGVDDHGSDGDVDTPSPSTVQSTKRRKMM